MGARTLFVGLDACDLHLAREFARTGSMPTLARLLDTAAVQETVAPLGFLVGATWPTIYTGTTPARHQFLCSGQVRGGTYENRWLPAIREPLPVWQSVSRAGGRVAVLDAPHAAVQPLNGVQLAEWGCHDRHEGTAAFPRSFLDEVNTAYGAHPVGTRPTPFPHAAPCDTAHRAGDHRTDAENVALLDDLLDGHRRKQALSRDLLTQDDWDLLFTVFGESHCTGHQFWKFHDITHPWHDPAELRAVGADPMRVVYAALDQSIGELLDFAGDDATFYVHLSHGMRAHYDGTCILEPVLWRLDQYASGRDAGMLSSAVDHAVGVVPRALRQRALSAVVERRNPAQPGGLPPANGHAVGIPEWVGQRRWWMQPNDSAFSAIRLNLDGREPNGRIAATRARDVACWLADRLHELVNVATGAPAVAAVYLTDDHYERTPGDPMADVLIDWNRSGPIDAVWSPATGVISVPYDQWRTGDHHPGGLLLACGPGIEPGVRARPMSVVDLAPTIAASLDVDVPSFDGRPHPDLVPRSRGAGRNRRHATAAVVPAAHAVRPRGVRRWSSAKFDIRASEWIEKYAVGLSRALHADHVVQGDLRDAIGHTGARVDELERLAQIAQVTAWVRHADVPESLLISVVMPTRDRLALLERAVTSVRAQTYGSWEFLVVDDASTDGTSPYLEQLAADDPRIRVFRFDDRQRSSAARNEALDHAKGDVIAYLDDDNRFDPDWLRALAWAYTEFPETQVSYGARVIDDDVRHQGRPGRSMPVIQFLSWDREAILRANLVDQNVIAHRPSPVRFDTTIDHFSDWDLLLQLTDNCDPLPLPVIAAHYYSDVADRLSAEYRDEAFVDETMEYIRGRTVARRQGDT